MKISIIIKNLDGNGAENVCVTIANKLFLLGYDIEIITLELNNCKAKCRLIDKLKIVSLNCDLKTSLLKLPKYLSVSKPSIIFSFDPSVTSSILVSKKICLNDFTFISRCMNTLSVKNKITLENQKNFLLYIKSLLVIKFLEYFYRFSDLIIAQCNGMRKDLIKNFGIKPEKCITIYNPIRESFIFNRERSLVKDNYILCVGRLHPQKSYDVAIRCFSRISNRYPDLKLYIAGKGELETSLKKQAQDLNIENRVNFIGYTEDVQKLYEKAKFTLLTSLVEGFPNNLLESIAMGTPIVAFDCPSGPSEIIVEGVNGFLVENKNETAMVLAMEKALNYDWDIEAIHKTSLKYSAEHIIPQYVSLINQVVKEDKNNE